MKHSEFLKWLVEQGVEVREGSKHTKLYYNGRQSTFPRHPAKELGKGLEKRIKKQLGL
ncbi:type II toxin-antitoxin system HicA family toxin [Vibrio fluvialis]|nr:type II toxin-antitoxin system HicA family toxin [Vibrio fluvialis]MBY8118231.1 type II toxin-antitoxin system HicA family toxin [Vibrio fluvialis]MBY8250787.1 type II toxin-antitoxin system HicA family toxin [Vibrio fluvialis]MBY8284350.1 type II toxin-antitoxin system HicA family toxin [Vibrio fluvialis]